MFMGLKTKIKFNFLTIIFAVLTGNIITLWVLTKKISFRSILTPVMLILLISIDILYSIYSNKKK